MSRPRPIVAMVLGPNCLSSLWMLQLVAYELFSVRVFLQVVADEEFALCCADLSPAVETVRSPSGSYPTEEFEDFRVAILAHLGYGFVQFIATYSIPVKGVGSGGLEGAGE